LFIRWGQEMPMPVQRVKHPQEKAGRAFSSTAMDDAAFHGR
jgi:hypothetical protein